MSNSKENLETKDTASIDLETSKLKKRPHLFISSPTMVIQIDHGKENDNDTEKKGDGL